MVEQTRYSLGDLMKILIINIDSVKIPNYALKKIEKYYIDNGDEVIWDMPLFRGIADKIYVSCIFDWNKDKCNEWEGIAEIGGSGYSLEKGLPKEIEEIKPRINLGFTTRGCIRNCSFCIVPKKEGNIRAVGDIYDLWDGGSKDIVILDNNIFALPEHFHLICKQLRKEKLKVDFNQGLDHRLLNQDIVDELKSIHHHEYRFAFDHPSYFPSVEKAIKLLTKNNIKKCMWYVLVGYDTTIEQDLQRINYLRDNKHNAYIQRYNYNKNRIYTPLARWVNQYHIFNGMTFKQFMDREENARYKKEWIENGLAETLDI